MIWNCYRDKKPELSQEILLIDEESIIQHCFASCMIVGVAWTN